MYGIEKNINLKRKIETIGWLVTQSNIPLSIFMTLVMKTLIFKIDQIWFGIGMLNNDVSHFNWNFLFLYRTNFLSSVSFVTKIPLRQFLLLHFSGSFVMKNETTSFLSKCFCCGLKAWSSNYINLQKNNFYYIRFTIDLRAWFKFLRR